MYSDRDVLNYVSWSLSEIRYLLNCGDVPFPNSSSADLSKLMRAAFREMIKLMENFSNSCRQSLETSSAATVICFLSAHSTSSYFLSGGYPDE